MLLLQKLLNTAFSNARPFVLVMVVVVLSACSDNVKEERASAPESVMQKDPVLPPTPVASTPKSAQVMWAVGDEWIQRGYMVSMLKETVANASSLKAKLHVLATNPSLVPLPLHQRRVYGGQNSQVALNSINDALLLPLYFRDLTHFFNTESTRPRDLTPVFGFNHQFLLVMSAQQWQPIAANIKVKQTTPYDPAPLLVQLRQAVTKQDDFEFAIQVFYDHQRKMLGIFAATQSDNVNYLQALLLNELHQSTEASLLDIPLAIPPWLKDGLKNQQERILRLEYMPVQ